MNVQAPDVNLSVFVPGLMGAGILLSAGILLADGIKRLVPNRGLRRRVANAQAVHGVVEKAARAAGYRVPDHDLLPRRLRRRSAYLMHVAAYVAAGVIVTRLFVGAYADPRATMYHNPWAIGLPILFAAPLLVAAIVCGSLAVLHQRSPERVRRLVARTWLGRLTPPPVEPAERARTLIPWIDQNEGGTP